MGKASIKARRPRREGRKVKVGPEGAVPPGRGATVQLKSGAEVALFNVGGEYYAAENSCPHKGFPLADSRLYGHLVECDLHGWQFDVRSGECLTKKSCPIETYKVTVEDGWIYVEI
jgi:nitrite reductase/ring-hydroxylating ferredoxin subunit